MHSGGVPADTLTDGKPAVRLGYVSILGESKGAIVGFILRVDVSAVAEIKSDSTQGISQLQSNYILSTFLELAMRFLIENDTFLK
jgi:hypothetical protein